jgi:hypothetical protein
LTTGQKVPVKNFNQKHHPTIGQKNHPSHTQSKCHVQNYLSKMAWGQKTIWKVSLTKIPNKKGHDFL